MKTVLIIKPLATTQNLNTKKFIYTKMKNIFLNSKPNYLKLNSLLSSSAFANAKENDSGTSVKINPFLPSLMTLLFRSKAAPLAVALLFAFIGQQAAFAQTTAIYTQDFNSYTTRQNANTTFGTSSGYWSSGEPAPPGSQNAILETTVGSGGSSFALWFVTGSSGTYGSGTIFSHTQTNTLNAQRYRLTYDMYTSSCNTDPGCSGTQSSFTTRVTGSSNVYNTVDGILPCRSVTTRTSGWVNTNSTSTTFAVDVSGGSSNCNDFWIDNVQIECYNPVISSQPAGSSYCLNATATPLSITATDAGTYRWYRNTTNSTSGGTLVQSFTTSTHLSTTNTYTPSITSTGTFYYYVVINEGTPCSVTSSIVAVTVSADTDGDGVSDLCDLDDDNDGILDADECFSTQRFLYTNFANSGGSGGTVNYPTGWILSPVGSGLNGIGTNNSVAFTNNGTLQTLTHDGNLTGVHRSTDGRITVAARVEFIDVTGTSHQMNLSISYAGTTYATLSSTTGASTSGTVTYSNGASGNLSTFTIGNATGTTAFDIEIYLPLSAPSTGAFVFTGDPTGRTVSGSTSDDVRLYTVSLQSCVDSDLDGTPDLVDLDSDNDGCPDAIEGDEKVLSSNLISNRISGAVDANGVPVLVNSGGGADIGGDLGQGQGLSVAAVVSGCLDSDGDGVTDDLDLDDDNDGILDSVEGTCTPVNISSLFTTAVVNTLNAGTPVTFTDVGGFTGFNLTVSRVNVSGTPTVARDGNSIGWLKNAVESGTLRFQFMGGFVRQVTFGYGANQIMNESGGLERNSITTDNGSVSYTANYGPLSPTQLSNGWQFLGTSAGGFTGNDIAFTINYPNLNGATFDFKDELISSTGGSYSQYLYDMTVCVLQDTDNDGLADHLDLDSDNDGCLDAIEGAGTFTLANLTTAGGTVTVGPGSPASNLNFGIAVDANGVPTAVGASGQGAGQAYIVNPAAVAGTASSNQTINSGTAPAALTLTGSTGTIQWQSSTDSLTFTNISGATASTYSPGLLSNTIYYRAVVSSAGGCTDTSNVVVITVNSPIPFTCTAAGYLFTSTLGNATGNGNASQEIFPVNIVNNESVVSSSLYTSDLESIATAYNSADNYMYGVSVESGNLAPFRYLRFGSDYGYVLGTISGLPTAYGINPSNGTNAPRPYNCATFDNTTGTMYVAAWSSMTNADFGGTPAANRVIYPITLVAGVPTAGSPITVTGAIVNNGTTCNIGDLTFVNGDIYAMGVNTTTSVYSLYKIDASTGVSTTVQTYGAGQPGGTALPSGSGQFGSAFLDDLGRLNLYHGTSTFSPPGRVVRVNPFTGMYIDDTRFLLSSNASDAASCRYTATPIVLSGTVFIDLDAGTPDGTGFNGVTTPLYANLLNADTIVIATTQIAADGTYSFPNMVGGDYQVQINETQGTISSSAPSLNLPGQYLHVSSTDATPTDGITTVSLSTSSLSNINFGINQILPDTVVVTPPCVGCPTVEICPTADDIVTNGTTTYSVCSIVPSQGTFTDVDNDGCYVFSPISQTDTVRTCIVACTNGFCDTSYVVISPYYVPTANPDVTTTNEDIPVDILVTINDDFGGDGPCVNCTITITGQPTNGTAIVDDGGTPSDPTDDIITYEPDPNFFGMDTLIYQICDADNDCDTAMVLITVNSVNDLPLANPDTATVNKNEFVEIQVTINDDFGGDGPCVNCTITITGQPTNGTAVVEDGGTPDDPTDDIITYIPDPNFIGMDTLVYQICDADNDCDTAMVVITVEQPVVSNPDVNVTFINTGVVGSVATNDDVPAGTNYGTSPTLSSSPVGSTPVLTMNSNGTYTFVADLPGVYEYLVPVCGPGVPSPCPTELLTITIFDNGSILNGPIANTDMAIVNGYYGTPTSVAINVVENDLSGDLVGSIDPESVTIVNQPANGTVAVDPVTGVVTYTPDAGFFGLDVFTYQVCDDKTPPQCAEAMVEVTVVLPSTTLGVMASDDYAATNGTIPVSGNVKVNDINLPEGDSTDLSVTPKVVTTAEYEITINADGSYTFEAQPGFTGAVNTVYEVCDNSTPANCAEATLYITVTDHITFDSTNDWNAGSDVTQQPDDTDGSRNVYVLSGNAELDVDAVVKNLYVASGASLNVSSCLTVNDGAMVEGSVAFKAWSDGFTTAANYGRYHGPEMANTTFEVILSESGWHNLGIPVHRLDGTAYRAADFVADNNDPMGDNETVNLTNDEATHNLWHYNSELASGREQGFFIDRNVASGVVPNLGSTYSTHTYGTWQMVADTDTNINRYGLNYFISTFFVQSLPKVLKVTGRTNAGSYNFSTHDNWGGWNLIPNPYPTVLDVSKLDGDPVNGIPSMFEVNGNTEFDRAIWIWNPGDAYQIPVSGQFSTGSYVAVDAQTGNAMDYNFSGTVQAGDMQIAPFQSFYIRRITASQDRRYEFGGGALDTYAVNPAVGPNQTTPDADGSYNTNDGKRIAATASTTNGPVTVTIAPEHRGGCTIVKHYKKDWDVIRVHAIDHANPTLGDATELVFDDQFTNGYDVGYDIQKLGNKAGAPLLFTVLDTRSLVINKMAYPTEVTSVPMGFYAEENKKEYRIELPKVPEGWRVYLEDRLTGKWHDLVFDGAYRFKNRSDVAMERFVLHFSMKSAPIAPVKPSITAWGTDGGIEVAFSNVFGKTARVTVTNLLGQVVYNNKNVDPSANHIIPISKSEPTVYIVTVVNSEISESVKVFY